MWALYLNSWNWEMINFIGGQQSLFLGSEALSHLQHTPQQLELKHNDMQAHRDSMANVTDC
jgi:hypothetical protein